jgi:hypothetical protein
MGTQFFFGQADRLDHIIKSLIFQTGQSETLPDTFNHLQVSVGTRNGIIMKMSFVTAFQLMDDFSAGKVKCRPGSGKINEFTWKY